MKSLRPIWHLWCEIYYGAALRQLSRREPLHPDIPKLVRINNDITHKLRRNMR